MKQVSLADMAVNAPTAQKPSRQRRAVPEKGVSKVPRDKDNTNRVQVAFRMDKDAYRELKRMALDEDTTVNDLILQALNNLRSQKGLKKFDS